MDQRANCNVFGYIDWTTGLLLSDNSSNEVYSEQQQQSHLPSQPPAPPPLPPAAASCNRLPQSPPISLPPVVQLTNTSTYYTPSYSIAPTSEIVTFTTGTENDYQFHPHQNFNPTNSYLTNLAPPSAEQIPTFSHDSRHPSAHLRPRYPFGHQYQNNPAPPSNPLPCSDLYSDPIPGPSRQSDSFSNMASRSKSKGKERSAKRGTSVMSEPTEEMGSRSSKFHRSHSSSLADYDDLPINTDDDEQEDTRMTPSPTPSDEQRAGRSGRQNHSEIEKRRRDKMNTYITELSRVVPMCITMSHKLDKLTVLRMAVQHLKTIRGAIHSYTEGDYKPSFLSDEELKRLILQSADGFLFVVGCDRGRILYVSESVSQVLNYSQGDLLGQSWFDILHPKDVAKVKEQLSSSDLSPRERLIDAKTMLPVKTDVPQGLSRLCPGARRSFFCRMKCRAVQTARDGDPQSSKHRKSHNISKEKKYSVVHCTGYLKSWASAKIGVKDHDAEGDVEACNLSCLVAVGRIQPSTLSGLSTHANQKEGACQAGAMPANVEFISRHTIDGKFVFVDQRATLLLGLLPQELLGTSMYEYYHVDDIVALTEVHKSALQTTDTVTTSVYRFRIKEGTYVRLQSRWKSFRNPWTKDIEFLVAKNTFIAVESVDTTSPAVETASANFSNSDIFYSGSGTANNQPPTRIRLFSMEVEASKIGQTVADEVLDSHRSRSRSSSAISSSTIRSPGSILSGSATDASPFSNVGSPLETETLGFMMPPGALPPIFSNEDPRRSVAVHPTAQPTIPPGNIPTVSSNADPVVMIQLPHLAVQMNSNGSGSNSSGSNSDIGGPVAVDHQNHNNNHNNCVKIRNNAQLLHILNEAGLHAGEDMMEVIGGLMMDQSTGSSRESNGPGDGNDEAAMAVVMSLLEADAGLGGPVDFSGLPWPLP